MKPVKCGLRTFIHPKFVIPSYVLIAIKWFHLLQNKKYIAKYSFGKFVYYFLINYHPKKSLI